MTIRLCRVCHDWHDRDAWPAACLPPRQPRACFPMPMINSDGMAPVQSQADGLIYDSKSAIRRHYREAGVVEVGTDRPAPVKVSKPPVEATVARALSQVGLD